MERRLAAILAVDLVGYSRLMRADEAVVDAPPHPDTAPAVIITLP